MSGPFVDQTIEAKNWYLADLSRLHGSIKDPLPASPFVYHRSSLAGKGITIHVLDSGGNRGSAELPLDRTSEVELTTESLNIDIDAQTEARIHGTTVAALAAGTSRGVAPAAQVKFWRVSRGDNPDLIPIATASATAMDRIVHDHNAESHLHVINCSWGALSSINLKAPTLLLLRTAVERAIKAGFLVVAAAGNDTKETFYPDPNDPPTVNKPGAGIVYPACIPGVLTVGAYDYKATRDKASFSNFGKPVDIWAPGVNIEKMDAAKTIGCGTSYAAPLVSGIAACILAEHQRDRSAKLKLKPSEAAPTLLPAEIIKQILHWSIEAPDHRRLLWWGPFA